MSSRGVRTSGGTKHAQETSVCGCSLASGEMAASGSRGGIERSCARLSLSSCLSSEGPAERTAPLKQHTADADADNADKQRSVLRRGLAIQLRLLDYKRPTQGISRKHDANAKRATFIRMVIKFK